jgi:hypothetical protein
MAVAAISVGVRCKTKKSAMTADPHPLPAGLLSEGLTKKWSEEVGKLLVLHDQQTGDEKYFIGVACHKAFANLEITNYDPALPTCRRFPIVGPNSFGSLDSSEGWVIPPDQHGKQVSYGAAKANVPVLGGTLATCEEGSHLKVHFLGARPWILDRNVDPLPERFIKELIPIVKLPYEVIKYALLNGSLPTQALKIEP